MHTHTQAQSVQGLEFPELEHIASEVLLPGGEDECRQDHRLVGMAADLRFVYVFKICFPLLVSCFCMGKAAW